MSPGLFKKHVGQTSCKRWGWLVIWQACDKMMFFMCAFIKGLDQIGRFHFICVILVSERNSFWCRVLLESTVAAEYFFFLFSFSHWKHLMIKVDTSLLVTATHALNRTLLNNYRNLKNSPLNKFQLLGSHPVADTLTSVHEDGWFPSDSTLTSGVAWLLWVEWGITEKKLQAERLMKANESAKIRSQKHWSQWSLEGKAVCSLPLRTPRGAPTHHVQTRRDRWQH